MTIPAPQPYHEPTHAMIARLLCIPFLLVFAVLGWCALTLIEEVSHK